METGPLGTSEKEGFKMQNVTVRKQQGVNYRRPIKVYDVIRDGEVVGILQTWGATRQVFDVGFKQVASHTTIKAAVRVAARVL